MFNFPGQSMFRSRSRSPIEIVKVLYTSLKKLSNQDEIQIKSKKNCIRIFSNLLRFQENSQMPMINYILNKPEILFALFHSYENPNTALTCGQILRECLKYEPLAKLLIQSTNFKAFFNYINYSNFDISSDAFLSFREALTRHRKMVAKQLLVDYDEFFAKYEVLVLNSNYAVRRLAIKLLADLLLDRTNFRIMTIFISKKNNLKICMNLLKDKSKNIQLESFHIFKIFVANPKKAPQIQDILVKNKDKLIEYLEKFHNDKNNDTRFKEEKDYVITQIQNL
ncbi:calcium-binding protein 39 [Neoconidiobolus thromboides FSU 785]|nr:calcium-binding protein 39 [Neoconidiobolus thromboides FSU 785]